MTDLNKFGEELEQAIEENAKADYRAGAGLTATPIRKLVTTHSSQLTMSERADKLITTAQASLNEVRTKRAESMRKWRIDRTAIQDDCETAINNIRHQYEQRLNN